MPVDRLMIEQRFGKTVADKVDDVTEPSKDVPYDLRKQQAYEHIHTFSNGFLLVKSADILSNVTE